MMMSGTSQQAYNTTNWFHPKQFEKIYARKENEVQKRCRSGDQKTVGGIFCIYGGKRCVFSLLQKVETEEQDRRSGGSLFHTVGAAKEKERLPIDVLI